MNFIFVLNLLKIGFFDTQFSDSLTHNSQISTGGTLDFLNQEAYYIKAENFMKAISLIINTRLTFFKLCAKNYINQNLKKIKCIQKVQREQTSRIVTNRITIFELINKLNVHWSIFIVDVHRRKFYEAYLIAYCTNIIICHKFKYQWNWFMLNPCI